MCLILFAWNAHPGYPLLVAANRDEFHERPTSPAGFWEEAPGLLAGRDLLAGGTWMGISRNGRFAAISNYRERAFKSSSIERSRGHLVRDFLQAGSTPEDHALFLQTRGHDYRGFNLLLGDPDELFYVSNRNTEPTVVDAGTHGLSNHLLDTDWPKVHSGRAQLTSLLRNELIDPEALLEVLADASSGSSTTLSIETMQSEPEELTRRIFIRSPVYGTRSSTALLVGRDGKVQFVERQFDKTGKTLGTTSHSFTIAP